jgi:sensor domain CHASE-containing protein
MRTKKRCTAEQFDQAVKGRQFTPERLEAARMVLVDGLPIAAAATATDRSNASVTQVVQLIFAEVQAQFRTVNPNRAPRPGFVILTVEVPALASAGMVAGVSSAGGVVLEEKRNDS